jgi:hypothetical protein
MSSPPADPTYVERQPVPWWMWLFLLAMAVSLGLVSLALFAPLGVLLTVAGTLAVGAVLLVSWSGRIEVSAQELRAGRAHIPLAELGGVRALDVEEARRRRGREIDPRAFHYVRPWVERAVVVEVRDPHDPTPYWYLTSRDPQRLAAALAGARTPRT